MYSRTVRASEGSSYRGRLKKKNKKQFAVLQLHFQSREREFSPSLREIRVIRVRVNRVKNDWKLSGV